MRIFKRLFEVLLNCNDIEIASNIVWALGNSVGDNEFLKKEIFIQNRVF